MVMIGGDFTKIALLPLVCTYDPMFDIEIYFIDILRLNEKIVTEREKMVMEITISQLLQVHVYS